MALGSQSHGNVAAPHVDRETGGASHQPVQTRALTAGTAVLELVTCPWTPVALHLPLSGPVSWGSPARHTAQHQSRWWLERVCSRASLSGLPRMATPLALSSGAVTLVGDPKIGGRGVRCRKSGNLGEPRSGRKDCSPRDDCGGLACGRPNAVPSGSVGGLGSLG